MYFKFKKKEITNSRIFHSSGRKKSQLNLENIYFLKKDVLWPRDYYSHKRIIFEMRFQCFFEVYSFHLLFLSPCGIRRGKIKRLGGNKPMT